MISRAIVYCVVMEVIRTSCPLFAQVGIDINAASVKQLVRLPGMGEKRAAAIIHYRKEHGCFKTKEEIMEVTGIGEKIYDGIKNKISVQVSHHAVSQMTAPQ